MLRQKNSGRPRTVRTRRVRSLGQVAKFVRTPSWIVLCVSVALLGIGTAMRQRAIEMTRPSLNERVVQVTQPTGRPVTAEIVRYVRKAYIVEVGDGKTEHQLAFTEDNLLWDSRQGKAKTELVVFNDRLILKLAYTDPWAIKLGGASLGEMPPAYYETLPQRVKHAQWVAQQSVVLLALGIIAAVAVIVVRLFIRRPG